MVVFLAVFVGGLVGAVKGEEAKQKYVFKVKSKYVEPQVNGGAEVARA